MTSPVRLKSSWHSLLQFSSFSHRTYSQINTGIQNPKGPILIKFAFGSSVVGGSLHEVPTSESPPSHPISKCLHALRLMRRVMSRAQAYRVCLGSLGQQQRKGHKDGWMVEQQQRQQHDCQYVKRIFDLGTCSPISSSPPREIENSSIGFHERARASRCRNHKMQRFGVSRPCNPIQFSRTPRV